VGALLALVSAFSYGLSDVVGGVVARRMDAVRAALWGQAGGLVAAAVGVAALTPVRPGAAAIGWGGLSGVGTGVAMAFLFRGLSRGALSVVVPVSAVGGLALPVVAGTVLLGDRPGWFTWFGVALAVPALWVLSRGSSGSGRPAAGSVRDGLIAGTGIAVQYLALARAGGDGLWPVLSGRLTALLTVAALAATALRGRPRTADRGRTLALRVLAGAAGVLAGMALAAYLYAVRTEFVTAAVVLSSLYPVVPVVAGLVAFRERLGVLQVAGLAAALVAAAVIAVE
jgi:drug/metabolite transporter (DMT)-like permease